VYVGYIITSYNAVHYFSDIPKLMVSMHVQATVSHAVVSLNEAPRTIFTRENAPTNIQVFSAFHNVNAMGRFMSSWDMTITSRWSDGT
jgi:hypothetical protein